MKNLNGILEIAFFALCSFAFVFTIGTFEESQWAEKESTNQIDTNSNFISSEEEAINTYSLK